MTHPQSPDPLSQALADLPRQPVTEEFTGEVLAALDSRDLQQTRPPVPWVWLTATTLILVSVLVLGYGYQRQRAADRAYRAQVEELRQRYEDLLDEVATVRDEVATPDTRLYLGGDERLDLVLDLSQTPTYQTRQQDRQDVRPASWEQ